MYRYKGKFYFGSYYDSANFWVVDTGTMKVEKVKSFLNWEGKFTTVFSIQSYHPDTLWLSTSNHIWWYAVNSGNAGKLVDKTGVGQWDNVMLFPADKRGRAWLCSVLGGRAAYYDIAKRSFTLFTQDTRPAIPFKKVKSVLYDWEGNTWLAGHALARWNDRVSVFDTVISEYAGPLKYKDDIVAITADNKGSLWLHNAGNGLLQYQISKKQFVHYDGIQYGLSSMVIQSLADRVTNQLWYTTGTRIGSFDVDKKTAITFGQQDGIPEERPSTRKLYFDSSNQCFYSLHENYFVKFKAQLPQLKMADSSFVFTSLTSAGKSIYFPMPTIRLGWQVKNFRLHYAQLDYENAAGYTFFYSVNNGAWVNNDGNRSIEMYNVKPGKLNISVKAIGRYGQQLTRSIQIKIDFPFWQQSWFILLCFGCLASLLYAIYYFRVRQIKKLWKMRAAISQDLHDEVGATLSGISMYSHLVKGQMETDRLGAKNSLDKMQKAAEEMVLKLNDIVWLANPLHDSLEKLLQRLHEYAGMMTAAKNMEFTYASNHLPANLKIAMNIRRGIFLICKEAINNAVKYSKGNHLSFSVSVKKGSLVIQIADNGIGFIENKCSKGNGLNNMYVRAAEMNALLQIESKEGGGTLLNLWITNLG